MLGRIIKLLFLLAVVGLVALTGFAFLGDLGPVQSLITVPVTLDAN